MIIRNILVVQKIDKTFFLGTLEIWEEIIMGYDTKYTKCGYLYSTKKQNK